MTTDFFIAANSLENIVGQEFGVNKAMERIYIACLYIKFASELALVNPLHLKAHLRVL